MIPSQERSEAIAPGRSVSVYPPAASHCVYICRRKNAGSSLLQTAPGCFDPAVPVILNGKPHYSCVYFAISVA